MRGGLGVAARTTLWSWCRQQLTRAEESTVVLKPLHPLPLWGQCGSTSKQIRQSTSEDKTLNSLALGANKHTQRRGFRLDWVTHDCGGEMTEEGEIRLKLSLHADWYLLLLTGHQCIQTTTSMTATAPGSSLHQLAKWLRSSESKGWRISFIQFQPNLWNYRKSSTKQLFNLYKV